jgi:hypothetical protein
VEGNCFYFLTTKGAAMTYIQPSITPVGKALKQIGSGLGIKGRGTCHDSQSVYLPSQGAYELDE